MRDWERREPLENWLAHLRERLLRMKHQLEFAEARALDANMLIQEVSRSGVLPPLAVLGPIIESRQYPPTPGGNTSGCVIQAALVVPGGLGVVFWDSDEYSELAQIEDALEADALTRHVPFEQCEPAIRALFEPHIGELVARFAERVLRQS
jgi:hypothetical protein